MNHLSNLPCSAAELHAHLDARTNGPAQCYTCDEEEEFACGNRHCRRSLCADHVVFASDGTRHYAFCDACFLLSRQRRAQ